MRFLITLSMALMLGTGAYAKTFDEMFPQFSDASPEMRADLEKLDYKQGKVFLGNAIASMDVPDGYYFLDAQDAKYVLSDMWGNPPSDSTLGMLFAADKTPIHGNAWGVEITFEDIGYVSDEDADGYDYGELLNTMKEDTRAGNAWRRENGYEPIALVGWADEPNYDKDLRMLHWAKELKFGTDEENTLNYNIRALGRKGVLVMNFIAPIDILSDVKEAAPEVMAMTAFTAGNTYADFDPSIDKVAAVGIGGLIAGKVLAKTGLLAVALVFLKKFWFILLLPLLGLRRLFSGRGES